MKFRADMEIQCICLGQKFLSHHGCLTQRMINVLYTILDKYRMSHNPLFELMVQPKGKKEKELIMTAMYRQKKICPVCLFLVAHRDRLFNLQYQFIYSYTFFNPKQKTFVICLPMWQWGNVYAATTRTCIVLTRTNIWNKMHIYMVTHCI